jgi:hypothetical protein
VLTTRMKNPVIDSLLIGTDDHQVKSSSNSRAVAGTYE